MGGRSGSEGVMAALMGMGGGGYIALGEYREGLEESWGAVMRIGGLQNSPGGATRGAWKNPGGTGG